MLSKVEVVYETLPGWQAPITSAKNFDDLPGNCKKYIEFIEQYLGTSIEWVGVGPERESMLTRGGDIFN